MTTTTAKIASCKLNDEKGVDEATARSLFNKLGTTRIGIVELRSRDRGENLSDRQVVMLEVIGLELAVEKDTEEFLRDLQRAIWRKREPQLDIQTALDVEPSEDEVLEKGHRLMDQIADDDTDTET